MPVRHSLLAALVRSTGQAKALVVAAHPIVASAKKHPQPDRPEFHRPDGAPLRFYSGATAVWH